MKAYLGWTRSSKMAGIYVHLSGKDTDDAILEMNGIKSEKEETKEEELKPRICAKCNKQNGATTRFCDNCGTTLDEEEARKIIQRELDREKADDIMNKLMKDPDFVALINRKRDEIIKT
jgi:ribosomal protein L40E